MSYQRSRVARTLLLCVSTSYLLLTACQPTETPLPTPVAVLAATSLAASSSPPIAEWIAGPQPTDDTLNPGTDIAPTEDLSGLTLSVARLPADQSWLFISDDPGQCGAGQTYRLVAVDRAGRQTPLDRGVTAWAQRQGAPPLLATCGADGVALLDPVGWKSVRLPLEPGLTITQVEISPDQRRAILVTTCWQGATCDTGQPIVPGLMVDLDSGASRPLLNLPASRIEGDNGPTVEVTLKGWGAAGLYYEEARSKAGGITLYVTDPDDPQAAPKVLTQSFPYTLDSATDRLVVVDRAVSPSSMFMFDLARGTTERLGEAAWMSAPAFSPDGTALSYIRSDHDIYSSAASPSELVIFDIALHTMAALATCAGAGATTWSQDSQRVIAMCALPGRIESRAFLLKRDGAPVGGAPTVQGDVLGVTNDDHLVLRMMDLPGVSWLSLRPSAAPSASSVTQTRGLVAAAYLPPAEPGAAPPLAVASPPSITQLPTPVAATPLAATRAPATELGRLPGDVQLRTELPMKRHTLYQAGGMLFSQPLRGGPPAILCGSATDWCSPLSVAPDERDAIVQLRDGLYRAPLDGDTLVRLTAPLTSAAMGIWLAQVSSDGRQLVYGVSGPLPSAWRGRLSKDTIWGMALFSAPTVGGPSVQLTPALAEEEEVLSFLITPDSQRVIYAIDVPDPDFFFQPGQSVGMRTVAIYSAPIGGGASIRLAESQDAVDPIAGMWLSDDGQHLLYQPRSQMALWSVPVSGGSPVRLSVAGAGQIFIFDSDAVQRWALYMASDGVYRAPLAGGAAEGIVRTTATERLLSAHLTPDGSQLVYLTSSALYRVSLAGGSAARLGFVTSTEAVSAAGLFVSNDSVVYQDGGVLISIALANGAKAYLTGPLPVGASLQLWGLSQDGRYVVYTVDQASARVRTILSVPIGGGQPTVLLAGSMGDTALSLINGGYAIGTAGAILYAAPLARGPRLQLSAKTGGIRGVGVTADRRQLIYVAAEQGVPAADGVGLYIVGLPDDGEQP